jgi:hypothetical protein
MDLIKKLLGGKNSADTRPNASTQFAQSESELPDKSPEERARSRNANHRDLVRVVLRETMRRHGIPSDWMDCRTLSVMSRDQKPGAGMHVQFLVHKADQQLLPYVHAFQESFWNEILKMDPTARDWLLSVGWEFYGKAVQGFSPLPDPTAWKDEAGAPAAAPQVEEPDTESMEGDTHPPEEDPDDVASDLQALHALMSAPVELGDELPQAKPREHKSR